MKRMNRLTVVAVKRLYMYLKEKGLTKIALLTASDGFGKDGTRRLTKLVPEFGIEVVAQEAFGRQYGESIPQRWSQAFMEK